MIAPRQTARFVVSTSNLRPALCPAARKRTLCELQSRARRKAGSLLLSSADCLKGCTCIEYICLLNRFKEKTRQSFVVDPRSNRQLRPGAMGASRGTPAAGIFQTSCPGRCPACFCNVALPNPPEPINIHQPHIANHADSREEKAASKSDEQAEKGASCTQCKSSLTAIWPCLTPHSCLPLHQYV